MNSVKMRRNRRKHANATERGKEIYLITYSMVNLRHTKYDLIRGGAASGVFCCCSGGNSLIFIFLFSTFGSLRHFILFAET